MWPELVWNPEARAPGSIPGAGTYFRFLSAGSRRAIVSYWQKYVQVVLVNRCGGQSRMENTQNMNQLNSRSHPRHLLGKRTAQKDTIIDITRDSQVNSNFPYRWSPASLTFNNYFYLFIY